MASQDNTQQDAAAARATVPTRPWLLITIAIGLWPATALLIALCMFVFRHALRILGLESC